MANRKRRIVDNNPNATLKEITEKLEESGVSLDFMDVTINRRDIVSGLIKFITTWRAIPYDRIENLPAMIKNEYGGGEYEVRIMDPNKKIPEPIEWPITIEGEPKAPPPPPPKPVQPSAPPTLPYGMPNMMGQSESLLDLLNRRYGLGEITRERFEEMKHTLGVSDASFANEHARHS